jgi:sRNA-binding protein
MAGSSLEVVQELRRLWPQAFCWPPRPLQIGIDQEIEIRTETDPALLAPALDRWVNTPAYLLQCAWPGTFDLDGRIAGVVTEIEAMYARRRLVIELGWSTP